MKYTELCVVGKEKFRAAAGLYMNSARHPGYGMTASEVESMKLEAHIKGCNICK